MNKDQEKKDILNYASDYGKDFHEKTLMEDARKKEIKKYEKDHERNNSKERTNIYVENLNIDKFDNSSNSHNTKSNADNDYSWRAEAGHDLNLNWEIPVSDPIEENSIVPQLPKSKIEDKVSINKIIVDVEKFMDILVNNLNILIDLIDYKTGEELDETYAKIMKKIIKDIIEKGDEITDGTNK